MAITLQRDGYWNQSAGTWNLGTINISTTRWAVYQFEGLPDHSAETLATSFSLVLPALNAILVPCTLTAYMVVGRQADPADGTVGSYLLAELATTTPTVSPTAAADWTIAGDMALTSSTAVRGRAGVFNNAWCSSYRDSSGALARTLLVLVKASASLVTGDSGTATLSVTQATANTGLVGSQYIRDKQRWTGVRVIDCPKTNIDTPEDEMVMDGWTRQLVNTEGYDPPLPRVRRRR